MLAEAKDHILIPSVTSKILRLLDSLKRSEGGASILGDAIPAGKR